MKIWTFYVSGKADLYWYPRNIRSLI